MKKCKIYGKIKSLTEFYKRPTAKDNHRYECKKCSSKQAMEYGKRNKQKQFKKGMNWDNYERYGWHVDHIIPCAKFDLSKKSQQLKCFHYTNLQPLWAEENARKKDNV